MDGMGMFILTDFPYTTPPKTNSSPLKNGGFQ